jgi:rare lipoprotein A
MRIFLSILLCVITLNNTKDHSISTVKINNKKTEEIKKPKVEVIETPLVDKLENINTATWYNSHGNRTASGEMFHRDSLTAAYNFCKLGSTLRITNVSNRKSVIVRVNDRMGYKGSNHIDLSKCAFDSIGNIGSGRIRVIIEVF